MRKVYNYCDVCGNEKEENDFSKGGYTWHSGFATVKFTNGIEDVCTSCSTRFENALQKEFKKIKEEFKNGKEDKTFRKCHHCGCEFSVAYSGNIDGKKYCSQGCYDACKEKS